LMVAPIFGNARVPRIVKSVVALGVSWVIFPTLPVLETPADRLIDFLTLVVREVLTGVMIGIVAHILFAGVQMAGTLIGIQMGFAIVRVMDPSSENQRSVVAEMYYLFALLMFLLLDGHHLLIKALVVSYRAVAMGSLVFVPGSVTSFVGFVAAVFVIGLEVAAPVLAVLFLADAAMGIVARTVPQMNVFIIGFPIKIALGLMFLSSTMPLVFRALTILFSRLDTDLLSLLCGM